MANALIVKGPQEGFWRAGIKFGPEETIVFLDDLTAEQIEEIKTEPLLMVSEADADLPRKKDKKPKE
ncbi:MAG: HI1506-related protein [Deltaproteobacteria bacterium]|nr:HI1506-related protein [Deltaproteobacteria bacterium]